LIFPTPKKAVTTPDIAWWNTQFIKQVLYWNNIYNTVKTVWQCLVCLYLYLISFERPTIVVCYIFVCIFCRLLTFIYSFLPLFGRISTIWVSNSLELDQTPSYSVSDQDLSCLQRLLQLHFFTLQSSKRYIPRIDWHKKTQVILPSVCWSIILNSSPFE